MKSYLVTVNRLSTRVDEYSPSANQSPEFLAIVDGERFQYFVKRDGENKKDTTWREKASSQAYYHARNSGHHVIWQPVTKPKWSRKKEISEKQKALF